MNCSRLARKINEIEKTLRFASRHNLPVKETLVYDIKKMELHLDSLPFVATYQPIYPTAD